MIFVEHDPIDDFLRHDRECQESEIKYPVCDICGGIITDETYYEISGEILCEDCMIEGYRHFTEDYITGGE